MGDFGTTFSVDELPEADSLEALPAGWYDAAIAEAEVIPTYELDDDGRQTVTKAHIKIQFCIEGPSHEGRNTYTRINIKNPSEQCVKIGLGELRSMLTAIGMRAADDSSQLIGARLGIRLVVKNSPEYGPQNDVKGYRAIGGAMPSNFAAPKKTASAVPKFATAKPTKKAAPVAVTAQGEVDEDESYLSPQKEAAKPATVAPNQRATPPWFKKA